MLKLSFVDYLSNIFALKIIILVSFFFFKSD